MVTWPMTSRNPRRCCEAVRSAILAAAWLLVLACYDDMLTRWWVSFDWLITVTIWCITFSRILLRILSLLALSSFTSCHTARMSCWIKRLLPSSFLTYRAPPPFRPGNPALCGSCPLVTPYYCRLGDLLCYNCMLYLSYHFVCMHVYFVFSLFAGLFSFVDFSFSTLILWLGLLTCKNRLPYNLYCVGGDVKHCTIQSLLITRCLLGGNTRWVYCRGYCKTLIGNCIWYIEAVTTDDVNYC